MSEPQYEIHVTNEPGMEGEFFARIYLDGTWLWSSVASNRQVAIDDAKDYVEWHKHHDPSVEKIEL